MPLMKKDTSYVSDKKSNKDSKKNLQNIHSNFFGLDGTIDDDLELMIPPLPTFGKGKSI